MTVDIKNQLLKHRNKHVNPEDVLMQVQAVLKQDALHEANINNAILNSTTNNNNSFNVDLLEQDNIFHIDDIQSICITYRLRFLESSLFKGEIPQETANTIQEAKTRSKRACCLSNQRLSQ